MCTENPRATDAWRRLHAGSSDWPVSGVWLVWESGAFVEERGAVARRSPSAPHPVSTRKVSSPSHARPSLRRMPNATSAELDYCRARRRGAFLCRVTTGRADGYALAPPGSPRRVRGQPEGTGWKHCDRVRRLADQRLTGDMRDEVLAAVDAAESARIRRNEIVHQDWVLRGRNAMRPVSELTGIAPEDLPAYLTEWERESKVSPEWQRVSSRSVDVVPSADLGRPPADRAGALGRDRPRVRADVQGRQLARNRPSGLRPLSRRNPSRSPNDLQRPRAGSRAHRTDHRSGWSRGACRCRG
jgi:hypothetical protein